MRTVLIGTDFVYDKNGILRPIEINTNVGLDGVERIESLDEVFNFDELSSFISTNAFTKVHFIGAITELSDKLTILCSTLNVEYEYHRVGANSITIPLIEDNDQTLIIRSAYDTTALVDDTYCKDKVEFMKLIQSQSFGSQFAYMHDDNTLVSNIVTINDNGVHPNFILKSRFPSYDENHYPKLFKISNEEELNSVISSYVDLNYFLMEFYYNENTLYENHLRVIRSLNILYPPTLNSISIGSYNKIVPNSLTSNVSPTYDLNTLELEIEERDSYITLGRVGAVPKLEDTDMVELADGTFKTALDLQVGDLLKTIDLPDTIDYTLNIYKHTYELSFNDLSNAIEYSTNRVTAKRRVNKLNRLTKITFTDATDWFDVSTAYYLCIVDNIVQFEMLGALSVGDKIILIDTSSEASTPTFVQKEISETTLDRTFFGGWEITVEREHLFLVKADPNSSSNLQSYVSIEHNTGPCIASAPSCNGPCSTQCPTCSKYQHCYYTYYSSGTCGVLC
jgi:hypothetical protein